MEGPRNPRRGRGAASIESEQKYQAASGDADLDGYRRSAGRHGCWWLQLRAPENPVTWEPTLQPVPPPWDDKGWLTFGDRAPTNDWGEPQAAPLITCVDNVIPEPISWLWEHRIPLGALTLLDGHPSTGKSTITLDLASRLSGGRRMPDGSRGFQGATLLLSTEDTLAKPIRERLEACGALLQHVYGLEVQDEREPFGRPAVFPEDVNILHQAILHTEAKLVVVDPIMAHLSSTVSANADQEVRRALTPLVRVATATGAAILLVRHLRKPERAD